jgi:hypothetical protein
MWHDVHLLPHLVPEAGDAVRELGQWLAPRLAGANPTAS